MFCRLSYLSKYFLLDIVYGLVIGRIIGWDACHVVVATILHTSLPTGLYVEKTSWRGRFIQPIRESCKGWLVSNQEDSDQEDGERGADISESLQSVRLAEDNTTNTEPTKKDDNTANGSQSNDETDTHAGLTKNAQTTIANASNHNGSAHVVPPSVNRLILSLPFLEPHDPQ